MNLPADKYRFGLARLLREFGHETSRWARDAFELLYPVSCLVCGLRSSHHAYLCSFCLEYRFERANPDMLDRCPGVMLPDRIRIQDALWVFDKGGYVQEIIHYLKYRGMTDLGVLLGRALGNHLIRNPWFSINSETMLLPVPLHKARLRKRGYNQSHYIAMGVSQATGSIHAPAGTVIRIKSTRTQTGLDTGSRSRNVSGAFSLRSKEVLAGRKVLIIDDVFTTGATVMELEKIIGPVAQEVGVATIVKA